MLAWFEVVVLEGAQRPQTSTSRQSKLEEEVAAFRRIAPGTTSQIRGLDSLSQPRGTGERQQQTSRPAGSEYQQQGSGSTSYSTSGSTSYNHRGASNDNGGGRGSSWSSRSSLGPKVSSEELMKMRASAIKALLIERGVSCQDCFDKESLAKRAQETIGCI